MPPLPTRRFSVRLRDAGHAVRIVEEPSFEAAAVTYVEDIHPPTDQNNAVSVIVRDLQDDQEHCFRIDLDSGDTEPCG